MKLKLSDLQDSEGLAFYLLNLFVTEDIFYLPNYEAWGQKKQGEKKQ